MKIRTPSQLLVAYDKASKLKPLELNYDEHENFIKAMRLSQAQSDKKLNPLKVAIVDKDVLLKEGVKSTVDGKMYANRREWNDHLKRNGCVEIGNDYNKTPPKREIRGDFNVRNDLVNAMKQKGVL